MFLQNRIVFFPLKAIRCILPVFSGDIPWSAGHSALLMFGAFQNHLLPVPFCFLCHLLYLLIICDIALFLCLFQSACESFFIDKTHSCGRYFQWDPPLLLRQKIFFFKKVGIEFPFCPSFRMRNIIPIHGLLPGYLTDPWHLCLFFLNWILAPKIEAQNRWFLSD